MNETFIISSGRTPHGAFLGEFKDIPATELFTFSSSHILKKIEKKSQCLFEEILNAKLFVFLGCVFQAGLGQNIARQVVSKLNLSPLSNGITINQVCGSGMAALILGEEIIKSHASDFAIVGGSENMSRAPHVSNNLRFLKKTGDLNFLDTLINDGLTSEVFYNENFIDSFKNKNFAINFEKKIGVKKTMGELAEITAKKNNIKRNDLEKYVSEKLEAYLLAISLRFINEEFIENEKINLINDEPFKNVIPEKFPKLKSSFEKNGIITPATSSQFADGAAAIILTNEKIINKFNFTPECRVVGTIFVGTKQEDFTLAPIKAIEKLCEKINWKINEVDAFEINEAFASVPILASEKLKIPIEKINFWGGACLIGHPLGESGARIIVTLINVLKKYSLKKGIAAICVGGGEGLAVAIEI